MSVNEETTPPQAPIRNKKRTRRNVLLLLTILFIVAGAAYTAYWFMVLRHHETTDNAYVTGNQIMVMPQISGSVTTVYVDNTDFVKAGEPLVLLDSSDEKLALEKAKTALANSVRQMHQQIINGRQLKANIVLRETELTKLQNDLRRREVLGERNVIGKEELQHAREAVSTARAALEVAREQYNANQAIILNTPIAKQPSVLQASTDVRNAWLALERTKILSPTDGYVSRRSVQVGAQVSPGKPLMAVVPVTGMWIDANFKETQLANMRIGQPAKITTDFYGKKVIYHGTVLGLDMGTGSAFSLLPAQNASGNWIKVVQRLPVRISLDEKELAEKPLRIGLSSEVTVDTINLDGKVLSHSERQAPAYHTDALNIDMSEINKLINEIIEQNAGQ
ncbi:MULTISPECIES: multidrug efflux MFS transporter periplasmic adaptor subunit EmrA [Proteus]|uniref:Multidrug efflux MFS transporter periplasmic adaptor subunit EmrA n=1 Tax=Proteus terrae subsp. cibarius TaxID=626774 RepID=A0A8I1BMD9_9GAMM|nr:MULTISPECIES: multidrug efflux MFS transporter periplasmic adaptor subunit EmrA [Proteus]MBG2915031.1 multidrug efflux MFS transporter periplasmic adaptor subunit EmrA [Proteus terrae subsp. cibarius]MCM2365390.1 multidrug efflux MFS transporter periplasmic adaptor subunit EmrA [Proteus sp. FZP2095]MCO4182855.1 multidrug efflux MFS transporter periplasmic adaptor subunit EmrA [Proteus terrae]MCO4190782.1 multidrug efflux MFS transporter periplasmic adaptor subunit EmrA [Proteus terrae]QGW02